MLPLRSLNETAPRNVIWTGGVSTRIALYTLIASICLLVFGCTHSEWENTKDFCYNGKHSIATVVRKFTVQHKSTEYDVVVTYETNTQTESEAIATDANTYAANVVGQSSRVTYLPNAPWEVRLGWITARDVAADKQNMVIAVVVAVTAAILLGIAVESSLWREYRLVRDGIIVAATVERVHEYPTKSGKEHIEYYRFELDGRSFKGAISSRGGRELGRQVGSQIYVVCDPKSPERNKAVDGISMVGIV